MKALRVVSYNIHKGKSATGLRQTVPLLQKSLKDLNADIIFLQEIQGRNDKKKELNDQPGRLARALGMQVVYGRNSVRYLTDHGNALLTRLPILSQENQNISDHKLEQRGVLHVRLALNQKVLHCFVVHLGLFKKSRQRQVDAIAERISRLVRRDEPIIMAGDFNDWNNQLEPRFTAMLHLREVFSCAQTDSTRSFPKVRFSLQRARDEMSKISDNNQNRSSLAKMANLARPSVITQVVKAFSVVDADNVQPRTFPVVFPWLRLDRMYQRGFAVESAQVLKGKPWTRISDHAPISARISSLG